MTEAEIIKGCVNKNQVCQRLLYERFAGKMLSLCQRYSRDQQEAKDITQEGFLRVFDCIHQFKFEGSFEGWVTRVFVSVATRHAGKRKIIFSDVEESEADITMVDPTVVSKLSEEVIHKLINSMPDGYRLVFNLNVIEGYSHDEIGGLLGIQASTSRTQLTKARRALQALILKQFNAVLI